MYDILKAAKDQEEKYHMETNARDALPISSYVILGLLEMIGPLTPYEMKKEVDGSIGYFWDFPRAQLYVDPERLAKQGLLAEEREAEGRRRRTYHITDAGRAVLRRWLRESPQREVELRDTGLLKLFFGFELDQRDIIALAQREAAMHRDRQRTYQQIASELTDHPEAAFALATLRLGLLYEAANIQFWDDIAAHPPEIAPESAGGSNRA
jgi:PadR family transcriptional regulator AphA